MFVTCRFVPTVYMIVLREEQHHATQSYGAADLKPNISLSRERLIKEPRHTEHPQQQLRSMVVLACESVFRNL